ncbi:carbonic anhydrase [Natronospira proteinivora]|uniref:Carbonic anhydrase n=1 Tax=Natronospira proteinivora TaxID=1807133 RepID=A0ABT1G7S3_9GAMM|nr:carbonate dehydratase [Natronospira proteinivora]MCP1726368.1 carbonic anhydrase [Natronospira proteinivora]
MSFQKEIFQRNRDWANSVREKDPEFFDRLAAQQKPDILWIGCSDSRVPANQITGMMPGEVFVHRNIANLVLHTDMNCQSVIQFAVAVLKVRHVVVCGHYACGGVKAALEAKDHGLIHNWLRNIKDIYLRHAEEVDALGDEDARVNRLCELNVINQVRNLAHSATVQNAWAQDQPLQVHGWIYNIKDGLLKDLEVDVSSAGEVPVVFHTR